MFSEATIFPARNENLEPSAEVTEEIHPRFPWTQPVIPAWYAAFEIKIDGRTRYFTFGDRQLAAQTVASLIQAVPAEFRSLLQGGQKNSGVSISLSLMNAHSLTHDGPSTPNADS